ncbi:NAD(P)/FAD-dependent oxidoreductase [Oscillochloris sp. ZM17-4]|uniref:phytoene desaturase family protein n=1 Tax=Oscillochloris sp. ZM17-4 TaxID=2866714 RepID=UPI001C72DA8B|nr:NAD(P)/FAD-dependent oxidoreductase [Oscillochloris sp. ZM17-4]MBX0326294.1 NAD(P)/FAD-dependent oxidoreductase [Oscillochloris sp. ZM17-4]
MNPYDAVIVGAGPNGLTAACLLARAGRRVLLVEARDQLGGACSSAGLTLPGFSHDLGSAVYPFGVTSPVFRSLGLERFGLRWVQPPTPLAHPLDGGRAATLERSVRATARGLGRDGAAYARLMEPMARWWHHIQPTVLDTLGGLPPHPVAAARFGLRALWPVALLARALFQGDAAPALLAGLGGHSFLPLEAPLSAAPALVLGALGHAVGWPIPQGGAQAIADALAACLCAHGGEIMAGWPVAHIDELPPAKAYLFDLTPRQLVQVAGDRLPEGYRRQLGRFRHGPGVFKLDYALDGPVPWAAPACARAATVHLGGTLDEVADAERAPHLGEHAAHPYVLLAQPTLFDPSRAPAGKHIVWAYCHVPADSTRDMTSAIEGQIERFAPGFRDRILARSAMRCADMQAWDANLIGGDISGGLPDWRQLITRPVLSPSPWRTPAPGIYLCSSSTPPGPGVHGMCGAHAAAAALDDGV